ncbi:MAG: biotin transporter BioY [Acidimicrobiales bacterium]|nr:MAG: biotin transporter BioY [Acidimicrobiales bacterium]
MTVAAIATQRRSFVLADLLPGELTRDIALVLAGAGLVGLTAQLAVPIPGTPVPVTGQTFAVLLIGAALGTIRGAASLITYLLIGLAGVPWFAEGNSGFVNPTFGYLIGFILAGAAVGKLAERGADRSVVRILGAMVLGNVIIFAIGVSWLMGVTHIGLAEGWAQGVQPFLIGGAIKTALAAGLLPGTWALLDRSGRGRPSDIP